MADQVKTSLTGTGATGAVFMTAGVVEIGGTFSATLNIQIDAAGDGTFVNAVDSSGNAIALTAPGAMRINNGVGCNTRVNCSAFTSGTINVEIKGF